MIGKRADWSFRLVIVCLAALSVGLPMAWISISKLLLVLVFLLLFLVPQQLANGIRQSPYFRQWTPPVVLVVIGYCAISLMWTNVDLETALESFLKHGKVLFILFPIALIHSRAEALVALRVFAVGQSILLVSAWLLVIGISLPWAVNNGGKFAVFSTYLDQSVILAASAAIFWHLRLQLQLPQWMVWLFAALALTMSMVFLEGRSGYVVAVLSLALAFFWEIPRTARRFLYILAPVFAGALIFGYIDRFNSSAHSDAPGDRAYIAKGSDLSSDGWRLNAWHRSLQAIEVAPIAGSGVGSWKAAIQPFEGPQFESIFGISNISNPHQEYLLWAVELGLVGLGMLVALFVCLAIDAARFTESVARAAWSLLAACAVVCMFNSALYDDLLGDYFCITLGLLFALGRHSRSATSLPSDPNVVSKAVI